MLLHQLGFLFFFCTLLHILKRLQIPQQSDSSCVLGIICHPLRVSAWAYGTVCVHLADK